MNLVTSQEIQGLPAEPAMRWLRLRDLLNTKMAKHEEEIGQSAREEYYTILASAADALNLATFEVDLDAVKDDQYWRLLPQFTELATRLSLQTPASSSDYSVALERSSKRKLVKEVENLRQMALASGLPKKQLQRILKALDDLQKQILLPRTDYARLMKPLAFVSCFVFDGTTFLAAAPQAIATITAVIGQAKEEEDSDPALLGTIPTARQIEDQRLGKRTGEMPQERP